MLNNVSKNWHRHACDRLKLPRAISDRGSVRSDTTTYHTSYLPNNSSLLHPKSPKWQGNSVHGFCTATGTVDNVCMIDQGLHKADDHTELFGLIDDRPTKHTTLWPILMKKNCRKVNYSSMFVLWVTDP